ncbi:MAG: aminotransferase class I/II-fold pyridoxal phosphate-dependent enzyme [Actinomycetes bacterium]
MTSTADPRGLRADAPLLDAYLSYLDARPTPFTIPGHKQRQDLVGQVVQGDVPLYGGLDTMKFRHGTLAAAQQRAAELWGADVCRFSVAGSTHGNQALALAVARPGDAVVVPRTLHRSLLLGLVLAGLEPVWVRPAVDDPTGLPLGVPVDAVQTALDKNPHVRAVFLGEPSYVGTCGDVAAVAGLSHDHGIPLVVDAAWSAHFGFHPHLPRHALASGADAMVTSAHKTLPAYSQAALVLARTERIDAGRLDRAFEATNTTSPAGAILASIDAARALLDRDGEQLLGQLIELVRRARDRLATVPGLRVLDGPQVDPAKLVVVLAGTGADGNAVERDLIERGMPVEMADRDSLIAMVTLADDADGLHNFTEALVDAVERRRAEPRDVVRAAAWAVDADTVMAPRDAFFAPHVAVPISAATGRVCAELVAPYPPGVPVLAPGERIGGDTVEALLQAKASGTRIAYAADPSLQTLLVIG